MGYVSTAKVALGFGVLLMVSPFLLFPSAGQLQCGNEVSRLDAGDVSSDEALSYQQLSDDAQRAFDNALASGDNTAVVSGNSCPDEFSYSDWPQPHTIEKNDTYYRLETYHAGSGGFAPSLESQRSIGLLVSGFVVCLIGVVLFNHGREPKTGDS